MMIDRLFKFLLPKESKFIPLLNRQVEDILKASELLIKFTRTLEHQSRREQYVEIKKLEMHCDQLTDQIFNELNNTFITPFDREDIHSLASTFDDVMDLINGSAKRVVLYKPREMTVSMAQMAEHIRDSAICLQKAVEELGKKKRSSSIVRTQCRKLHELENSADDIYEHFMISLFDQEKDAIEVLKQVEIMQILESATDKAYRATDVLKTIIVKYA